MTSGMLLRLPPHSQWTHSRVVVYFSIVIVKTDCKNGYLPHTLHDFTLKKPVFFLVNPLYDLLSYHLYLLCAFFCFH
jgi:hypothetical protein